MQTWVRGERWESPAGLVGRILSQWEEHCCFCNVRSQSTGVKIEKHSRFNINKICWYKRSTWCYGGKVWGELRWELYLLETLFSKLVLAFNVISSIRERSWEHMPGFSSSAADLSCQFVEWFIGWSFWRIVVSISQNEKWLRMSIFISEWPQFWLLHIEGLIQCRILVHNEESGKCWELRCLDTRGNKLPAAVHVSGAVHVLLIPCGCVLFTLKSCCYFLISFSDQ